MKTKAPSISNALGPGRVGSLCLYILAALAFAGLMIVIGAIPHDGGGTAILYQSFGQLALFLILIFLFREGGFLGLFPLPEWSWLAYGPVLIIAAVYCLAATLPLYFYFRTRRSVFLCVQLIALALHSAFAVFVVAPFWISQ